MISAAHRASNIKAVIFDVDGVLTDGGLYLSDDGQETKRFHANDGLGMSLLRDAGVLLAIITGRQSQVVAHRAAELKIEHLYQGVHDKLSAFDDLTEQLNLPHEAFAYMGDDIIDLPVMRRVGLALTVPHACPEITAVAHWTSTRAAGNGAAREACELILKSQGLYGEAVKRFMV